MSSAMAIALVSLLVMVLSATLNLALRIPSRSRMKAPPKIFLSHSAYMRCLIASVKAFASLGESFLPISNARGC